MKSIKSANPQHNLTEMYNIVTFGLKTPLHVLGKHNGMKTELYQTNAKIVSSNFALIIIIVVHMRMYILYHRYSTIYDYTKTSISN